MVAVAHYWPLTPINQPIDQLCYILQAGQRKQASLLMCIKNRLQNTVD